MKNFHFILLSAILLAGCESAPDSTPAPKLELSENTLSIDCLGGETRFEITHNYAIGFSIAVTGNQWFSLNEEDTLENVTSFVITTLSNVSEIDRTATITFSSEGLEEVLTITQEPLLAEVSSPTLELGYEGIAEYLTFTTTASVWSVDVISGGDWCFAEKEGEDRVAVTADTNSGEKRVARIEITAGKLNQTVVVTQNVLEFEVTPYNVEMTSTGGTTELIVNTTATGWDVTPAPDSDWLTAQRDGDKIVLTVGENPDRMRSGYFTIEAPALSRIVNVLQFGGTSLADKDVVRLQNATKGSGVNIVIMGDGYVASELASGGKYERDVFTAMEAFFSVYPFTHYREYFNVWMVGAVSNESGLSYENPRKNVDTVFRSLWEGPASGSTGIECNETRVRNYAALVASASGKPLDEITTIIPINDDVYAGTCYMGDERGSNFSISLCPTGSAYEQVVVHEAGGHGFGKLMDEYIYYPNQQIPSDYRNVLAYYKETMGWYANIDFASNIYHTSWADFADLEDYPMVSTFEGSYMFGRGIWRPEYNSCMNNNVYYFNAPSRYAQMQRIHDWGDVPYTFEDFLEDDIIPPYPSQQRAIGQGVSAPFVPLGLPKLLTIPVE